MNKITNNNENTFLASWLEGTLSDEEFKKLVSENEYLEYLKMRKSFDIINELNSPLDATLSQIKEKVSPKSQKTKIIPLFAKWSVGIAASLILFLGLYSKFSNPEVIYQTGFGEQKTIALLDGSEVILNANSTLKFNKKTWESKRELSLSGEAYFKVTKVGNTFTVNTDNGNVTVLGTHFNVKSIEKYFDVICYEGKVRVVTKNKSKHILTPNKQVVVIQSKVIEKNISNISQPQWLSGESTFDEVPLKYVIAELENQYNIKITTKKIDDTIKFTGSFTNGNLKMALATVFKPLNITYQIKNKNVILHKVNR